MRYLCVLMLITLAACDTTGSRREGRIYRLHGAACEQLGYKATTNDWANCAIRLERARQIERESFDMETAAEPKKTMKCDFTVRPTVCK